MQPKIEYELITSQEKLPALAQAIAGASVYGLDIETASKDPKNDPNGALDPRRGNIRLIQYNVNNNVYVVDLYKTGGPGPLIEAMKDSKAVVIGQQLKFETKWFLFHHGLELTRVFDTWRADVIIHNGKKELEHHLYAVWERWLGFKPQSGDRQRIDWSGELGKEDYDYAAEDVLYLLLLRDQIKPALAENGLNGTALLEFNVILPEAAVELNGFPFDAEAWIALATENQKESERLNYELIRELPSPTGQLGLFGYDPSFNLDSSDQVLASLRKLGLKQRVRVEGTNTHQWVDLQDTKEMTLAGFAAKYPIIEKFLKYREVSKQVSSFGPEYLANINRITNRIHSEYFPFTGAGRYSCNKPNLQQIPRAKKFRKCFRAPDGKIFILADYSGVEMRIVAEISGDEELINVFRSGQDAHYATASIIMEKLIKDITKDERQMAKPVNFGFIYGMMAAKLVLYAQANYGVTMSEQQAKRFRDRFFAKYNGIERWHKRVQRDGQRQHMAWTIGGRLRYLGPDAYNEFYNTPVQGTGADALKRSLRIVYERLKRHQGRAKIVHHVHDEIIVEADNDPDLIAAVKEDLHDGMADGISPYLKRVPVEVEPSSGFNWAEAK
jgi:DNA polymerase-1